MTHTWPSCTETGWCTTTFVLFLTRRWFTRIKLRVVCHLFMGWLTRARTTEHSIFGDFHCDPAANSLTPFVSHLYNVGPTSSSTLVQHFINVIQMFCVYWPRGTYIVVSTVCIDVVVSIDVIHYILWFTGQTTTGPCGLYYRLRCQSLGVLSLS